MEYQTAAVKGVMNTFMCTSIFFFIIFQESYTIVSNYNNISLLDKVTVLMNLKLSPLEVKQVVLHP